MKEKSLLLQLAGDTPVFRIIDFLVDNKGVDCSKKNIIDGAGISKASLFNYWAEMEKYGLVRVTRAFGKTKLFTLNTENPITQKILELESTLIRMVMLNAKKEIVLA